MSLEELAFSASMRALDKQEAVLEELRGRTGMLLGASALAASFLGTKAFEAPTLALASIALGAFLVSVAASVWILVPRRDQFVFAVSGPALYEELYEWRDDLAEVYHRLAYDLQRFWTENDRWLQPLFRAYRIGSAALVVEILALAALVSDTLV